MVLASPYAALWNVFGETNDIYSSTLVLYPEETLTRSADAAKQLVVWSETYRLNYPWVLGTALYIMLGWQREGTREHRCGTLTDPLLKATDETRRETTYFSMCFELLPHPKAPWAGAADWLCYRAPPAVARGSGPHRPQKTVLGRRPAALRPLRAALRAGHRERPGGQRVRPCGLHDRQI